MPTVGNLDYLITNKQRSKRCTSHRSRTGFNIDRIRSLQTFGKCV